MTLILALCLLALAPGSARGQDWQLHEVGRGETLYSIARRYDVSVDALREWNRLRGDRILVGQKLRIPAPGPATNEADPAAAEAAVHVVQSGETLTAIARRHGLTLDRLRAINGLTGDRIYAGQKLRLRETARTVHLVESGDALWEIARAYGVSVAELKRLNGLSSDRIYPGQELQLSPEAALREAAYRVRRGDSLGEIAQLHQMSLRELMEWNGLRSSVIHPGQQLKVRPRPGTAAPARDGGPTDWDWRALRASITGLAPLPAESGPYYYDRPRAPAQRSRTYVEENRRSTAADYAQAKRLWSRFAATVAALPRLSNRLAGWHFVLDPGHGGVDPGTIVRAVDSQGQAVYVVEDEYMYDLALRVYVLLRLHGADATLTLLSPNHLLRGNEPASSTFVHERNEVINGAAWSRRTQDRPRGTQRHLDARIGVAREAFRNVPRDRQVFLSFHADNVKSLGNVVTLFYQQNTQGTDTASRDFARRLLPALGAGARVKQKNLGVLRNNPARYKLLVEMRNLAFGDHVWAIRYEELRQRDAAKVVQALLDELGAR